MLRPKSKRGLTLVEVLVVIAIIGILLGLMIPAVQSIRRTARKLECTNKVKQLTLATLSYHSSYRRFPSGTVDNDDNHRDGLHSGFVYILDLIEMGGLDRQYDRSQAWNSPANVDLAQIAANAFLCPQNRSEVQQDGGVPGSPTDYAFCKGDLAYLSRTHNPTGIFDINSRTRSDDITDGTSTTFLIGEAASNRDITATTTSPMSSGFTMGQVWSSADFDGLNETGFQGGRGSALAVTAQNPGPDGIWDTLDDLLTPLNVLPTQVSIDWTVGTDNMDPLDRVRGFHSEHIGGAVFGKADGSVTFVVESINPRLYRHLSTMNGGENVSSFE